MSSLRKRDKSPLLAAPNKAAAEEALARYAQSVRDHYGARLAGVYLFGSRARGDDQPDSDADVAVVLEDGDWRFSEEKHVLSRLAIDALIEPGLYIQGWPLSQSEWSGAEVPSRFGSLIETARRDARALTQVS